MPAPATATADEIRDVNTRYHDGAAAGYDAKWGIDYGEVGQGQVLGKVRKALGEPSRPSTRALEIGAGTGYFSLNLLQAGVVARGDLHRHLARHARRRSRPTPSAWASTSRPRVATPRTCRSPTPLRPRLRPRRPAPPARPRPRLRASSAASCARAGRSSSPASRRATATGSRPCPSAPRPPSRRSGGGAARRGRAAQGHRDGGAARITTSRSYVDVHAFTPDELRGTRRARGLRRRARARRGAARQLVRLGEPRARGDRRARRGPVGMEASTRSAATSRCRRSTAALLEPRLPPAIFYNLMVSARRPAEAAGPPALPRPQRPTARRGRVADPVPGPLGGRLARLSAG